jgi:hypothetical protein
VAGGVRTPYVDSQRPLGLAIDLKRESMNAIQYIAFRDELEKISSRFGRVLNVLSKGGRAVRRNPGKSLLGAYLAAPGSFVATGLGVAALANALKGKKEKAPAKPEAPAKPAPTSRPKRYDSDKVAPPKLKLPKGYRRPAEDEAPLAPKNFDWNLYDETGIPRLKPEGGMKLPFGQQKWEEETYPIIYPDEPGAPPNLDEPVGLAKRRRDKYLEMLRRRRRRA